MSAMGTKSPHEQSPCSLQLTEAGYGSFFRGSGAVDRIDPFFQNQTVFCSVRPVGSLGRTFESAMGGKSSDCPLHDKLQNAEERDEY
jgi:hypothetical protein